MIYWLSPLRRPRQSCGSVTGLQAATLTLMSAFVLTLVLLGNELLLAGGIAVVLLAMVLGVPIPRFAQCLLPGPDGGAA